jgi:hypothetical protein
MNLGGGVPGETPDTVTGTVALPKSVRISPQSIRRRRGFGV